MRKICFDEDNGDADLILQRVEVPGHVALLVAEVNDDLRVGSEQRLEVQICLAAVHLTGLGQRREVRRQKCHLALAGCRVDGDHALRGNCREDHRRNGAAGRDAGDVLGQLDFSFEAVGEGKRFRFCGGFLRRFGSLFRSFGFLCGRFRRLLGRSLFGLRGVIRSRLLLAGCAAGHERGEHCKHKQKRKNSSFHFRTSCEWRF